MRRNHFVLLSAVIGATLSAGCAGTSPAVNPPQMQVPGLRQRGVSGQTSAVERSAAETTLAPLVAVETPKDAFTVLPYLQLGDAARNGGKKESVAVLWQGAASAKPSWSVESAPAGSGKWSKTAIVPAARDLNLPETPAQRIFTASLTDLEPGALFDYRVLADGKPVFVARARARQPVTAPYKFVVFGDCGTDSKEQKEIAYQAAQTKPDFVFITGDIVYERGRYSEYRKNFFPIYNADTTSAAEGASLLRSTLMLAAPGNHDLAYKSMDKWPDGLAYFYCWDLPKNGPALAPGAKSTPRMNGNDAAEKALMDAAGPAYPRMANYSFDYGNSHWTVLDSNSYVDWTDPALRAWVEKDLAAAKSAAWRFVSFHHPPFHSSKTHQDDQWMRSLCDLFEKYNVAVVWSGHVHNYQRSHPLRFTPATAKPDENGRMAGKWTLDKNYDGDKVTAANAPIYIVTGGGGASLYDPDMETKPETWQPFTAKYNAHVRSMTTVEIEGKKMSVRQIGEDGKELDHWTLTKN